MSRPHGPSTACVFGWTTIDAGSPMWALPGYGDHLEELNPGMRAGMKQMGAPEGFENVVATILPREGGPAHWSVTFAVDDVDAIAARARELGGSVLAEPRNARRCHSPTWPIPLARRSPPASSWRRSARAPNGALARGPRSAIGQVFYGLPDTDGAGCGPRRRSARRSARLGGVWGGGGGGGGGGGEDAAVPGSHSAIRSDSTRCTYSGFKVGSWISLTGCGILRRYYPDASCDQVTCDW